MYEGLVSILIPTFNRSKYLGKAIDSCLSQSYRPLEIIVTDNASTDSTGVVVNEWQARSDVIIEYYRNANNIGPVLNWKKAYNKSKGEYVVLLSDDDFFIDVDYLCKAVSLLKNYQKVNLVVCNANIGSDFPGHAGIVPFDKIIPGDRYLFNFWSGEYQIPVISNVFRRNIISPDYFWNTNSCLYSDIELWLKLMLLGDIAVIREPSVFYRFHSSNIVTNMNFKQLVINSDFILSVYSFRKDICNQSNKTIIFLLLDKYCDFIKCIFSTINHDKLYRRILFRMQKAGYVFSPSWHCFLKELQALFVLNFKRIIKIFKRIVRCIH